jgi:hypothetical protein
MKKTIVIAVLTAMAMTVQAASPNEMVYDQVSQYVGEPEAEIIAQDICNASYEYNVDPILAAAVFTAESHFDNNVVSPVGAIGIAQLMPDTAASLGVDPYDEQSNIYGSVAYLADQVNTFGNYTLAEAAYNAGPGAVEEAGGIPNYAETINYVNTVESIRQDIWDRFGGDYDSGYSDYDSDDAGDYEKEAPAVNMPPAGAPVKTKKAPQKAEVPDTIRVWPPLSVQHQ